ncbi:MAG: recombinase family protein [Oscillospiraceae bacterium]|nr:recombinase family protein [Oscillospiraceae bacterium]
MEMSMNNYKTACYCRLSQDDDNDGTSVSIETQTKVLADYCKAQGFDIYNIYTDDGYTGTNFDRPDFKRLIEAVEDGKIGTVIVKDLSRFGREYLQTGFYTEMYLPDNDVRFIAINDSVDSDEGDNDFAPFRNIINEWYAKDCSKKIRAVMKMKAQRGDCLTGMAPYGYMKDPNDKTKLIPNDRADYVKMMYRMAIEGCSCGEIATKMRSMNLPIPKADNYIRNGLENCASYPKYPYYWLKATVKTILLNPVYTGRTVALRYTNKSYKNKKRIERPEDEWVVTENTHEALVSREDYDTVYKRLSVKTRDKVTNPDNIFRGLVMCPDCGKVHGFSKRYDNRNSKGAYRCQTAIRYGKEYCSSHYITFEQLYDVVLSDVQRHATLFEENADKYIDILSKASETDKIKERTALIKEQDKSKKRIGELDTLLQKIYEDMVFGVISKERYMSMSENMENELSVLKARSNEISAALQENDNNRTNAEKFAELIEDYIGITELDYELVHTLIEKIYIHERENINGKAVVKVDIYYRFIGNNADSNSPTEICRRRS